MLRNLALVLAPPKCLSDDIILPRRVAAARRRLPARQPLTHDTRGPEADGWRPDSDPDNVGTILLPPRILAAWSST